MPKQLDMLNLGICNIIMATRTRRSKQFFYSSDMLGQGTNWQDELTFMNIIICVSGGNEKTTYAFSGVHLDSKWYSDKFQFPSVITFNVNLNRHGLRGG